MAFSAFFAVSGHLLHQGGMACLDVDFPLHETVCKVKPIIVFSKLRPPKVSHIAVDARAKEILKNPEETELSEAGKPRLARRNPRARRPDPAEAVRRLSLFGDEPV